MNVTPVKETFSQTVPSYSISYQLFKRIFDILISTAAMILLLPVFGLVAVCIWLMDGKPVLFRQQRIGSHHSKFTIYKFRTMKTNQKSNPRDYDWPDGIPDDYMFKTSSNPNVTKLGGFLRKYSLDELPQLYNVFKGDMSIVGPRPEIPQIARYYNEKQSRRLVVKPGITGYAQIKGRADIPYGKTLNYDLYYVDHCSLYLDFIIFMRTILFVLLSKGAY